VLACRSRERGAKLLTELQAEAARVGHTDAKIEARAPCHTAVLHSRMPFQLAPRAHLLISVSSLCHVKVHVDRPDCSGHGNCPTRAATYQQRAGLEACAMQVMNLDLASLRSVRAFADSWRRRKAPLHVLVNNAGIFSMGGASRGAVTPRHAALQEAQGERCCPSAA